MICSFWKSLHFRLIALILLASLPMAGLILLAGVQEREHAHRHEEEDAVRLARIMVAEHERVLTAAGELISSLSLRPEFWFAGPRECSVLFQELIEVNPGYSGIALTEPDGDIVCSYPASPTPRLGEASVIRAAVAAGGVVVSNHTVGSLSGKEIVIVAAPVRSDNDRITGVLAVGIDLEWTADYIELVQAPDGVSFMVIDRNGVVLIRHPETGNYLGSVVGGQPIVMEVRASGEPGLINALSLDGAEHVYAYAPVQKPVSNSGYVLVGIPVEAAYAEADRNLVRNLAGLGIITVFILGAARVSAMHLILKPVGRLNRAMACMQAGDLSARTGVDFRGDEITGMARAFDELAASLQESRSQLNGAYDRTLEGWSRALDLRDHETEGHSQRVTLLSLQLAREMGLGGEALKTIRRGALLHDIGKIGVPDAVLNKPGPLTDEEWVVMRRHPEVALELLADIDFLAPALEIPHRHHERWDGGGYPDGLAAEAIPLAARIFAVADVWDALRSDRPYRKAWDDERALAYIRDQSGAHFDPNVVAAFLRLRTAGDAPNGSPPAAAEFEPHLYD